METAEIYQFPARRDDAQSSGPDSPDGPARSPQLEDGYTRIANPIMDALCAADFTAREYRVVMFVIRETYGWGVKAKRMSADYIASKTGMDASRCSKVLNELIRRNVLKRHGGSRSPVSLNKNAGEWEASVGSKRPIPTKRAESAQNEPTQPAQNEPTKKDKKDNPSLTSFERGDAHAKNSASKLQPRPAEKPVQSSATKLDLTKLPKGISVEAAEAFIEHRKVLKKPLTQRALMLAIGEAVKASQAIPGLTPDQAIDEAILAGWQGVKAQWLMNRLSSGRPQGQGMTQAERIHAANQEACRQAVANMQAGRSAWKPIPDFEYGDGDMFDA